MKERNRLIAFLCAFTLVAGIAFSGCAKRVKFDDSKTTTDGRVTLGAFDDIPEGSEIVIGADGQSYLVDGEGNSVVYEPPTAYVIPGVPATNPVNTTTTTTKPTTKPTIKTIPTKKTTESTTSPQDAVIAKLKTMRMYGKNTDGYGADKLYIEFEDEGKQWLVEFHKGGYGSSTVGCEIGVYKDEDAKSVFVKESDSDKILSSAKLYSGRNEVASFGTSSQSIAWRYSFKNAAPSGKYTVIAKVSFPTTLMADAFMDALDENGFEYSEPDLGLVDGNQARFYSSDDGKTVNILWK